MAQRYILLMRWADQGIRNFKDTIARTEVARSKAEKIGGKFTSYWTFGKYNGIGIPGDPHDEAVMQFGLKVGRLGNVRTTTLRASLRKKL
jgi:uncharacterized protein with GYD domain